MPFEKESREARPRVWLYIFSISVDWSSLEVELNLRRGEDICILTSQHMFPCERLRVELCGPGACHFRTFHDLMDERDMESCDEEADRILGFELKYKSEQVAEYYSLLTRLKNETAARRLGAQFDVQGGAVFCNDLGIVAEVWCSIGLIDRTPSAVAPKRNLLQWLREKIREPIPLHYLLCDGERWLLVGRPERVSQFLDWKKVRLEVVGWTTRCWISFQFRVLLKMNWDLYIWRLLLRLVNWPWRLLDRAVTCVAAASHAHNPRIAKFAVARGLEYVNLQDSFLPSYYPSRYLLYRPRVARYYVWDRFSQGIFSNHGLKSVVWSGFQEWKLPTIDISDGRGGLRRILYISSGAGDWTALKNRSDEDLTLALLMSVARQRPDITICYRPHPLWLHPQHQGLISIKRAIDCIADTGLANLIVSQGAQADGSSFSRMGNLSLVSSTVEEDIAWADMVLGEHSQMLLVAARRGKLIAGVNVSKHAPYFGDYVRIGFPLVTTATELNTILLSLETDCLRQKFLREYNEAIVRHNRENCGSIDSVPHPA